MIIPEPLSSTAGYGEAAEMLVEQYESVSFAEVHRDVLHLFPAQPSAILDIGAGSGRDAAALAGQGHVVVAAEPTAELRALGQQIHDDRDIEWVDDSLPEMRILRSRGQRFDLILLTAVWMHLDELERSSAMRSIADLLAGEGRVVLSLRHGPVPAGRRMFDVSAHETIELARGHGLSVVHHSEREDPHARQGVRWSYLGLQ
ncbi:MULTISPECIES: bifunctional 2-polyprenyl-6-hydroxyphenol methylase/3-demethylubiquinol 3-O-methyltransferase UbiG [unclassified Kitasatospora]|uniref:class I SAM-dependent methyltransferase n=1 Tax=unclassified Kitasatospora TaxID=2633591 RepID=UPI001F2C29D6|nr:MULTISPECIES: class I SAM-dependent methyltransferase [unclassified Kitasatospora]